MRKWILAIVLVVLLTGCVESQQADQPPYVLSEQWGQKVEELVAAADELVENVAEPVAETAAGASIFYPPLAGIAGILGTAIILWKKLRPEISYWQKRYTAQKRGAEKFRQTAEKDVAAKLYSDIGNEMEKQGV